MNRLEEAAFTLVNAYEKGEPIGKYVGFLKASLPTPNIDALHEKTQRILRFVKGRKLPVQAEDVADHFCISVSSASKHLRRLYLEGILFKQRSKSKVYWSISRTTNVAVPKDTVQPVIWPKPIYTSYPNIRGYDD